MILEYSICESALKRIQGKQQRRENTFFGFQPDRLDFGVPRITRYWYHTLKGDMDVQIGHLEGLKLHEKQLHIRKDALRSPKVVVSGLVIFLIISAGCDSTFSQPTGTADYHFYLAVKRLYIGLFSF